MSDAKTQRKERAEKAMADIAAREHEADDATMAEVAEYFIYATKQKRFYDRRDPTEGVFDREGFDAKFAHLQKSSTKISTILLSSKKRLIRKIDYVQYLPGAPEFPQPNVWNPWKPSDIVPCEPQPGDLDAYYAHLEYILPNMRDQELFLNWQAGVLQKPQTKPRHQMLLMGKYQGGGKSFFARVFSELIGQSNVQPLTQDIITSGFTGWAKQTKLVTVEEVRNLDKSTLTKKLHPWASETNITVNEKNLPTWRLDQVIAFWLHSNKGDALQLDLSDRRYLVLETKAAPKTDAYYDALYAKYGIDTEQEGPRTAEQKRILGAIMYELLHRDLGDYKISHRAPDTDAKRAMVATSGTDVLLWVRENAGEPPFSYQVFKLNEWIEALPSFMQNHGILSRVMDAARDLFHAEPFGEVRPQGRKSSKISVWVKDADKLQRAGDLLPSRVLRMYREERGMKAPHRGRPAANDNAGDDFAFAASGNPWD